MPPKEARPAEPAPDAITLLREKQLQERRDITEQYQGVPPVHEQRLMKREQRKERKELLVKEGIRYRIEQQDERDRHEGYQPDKLTNMDETFRDRENRPQCTVVHIRVQKRSARKWITTIQNLSIDLDLAKICSFIKQAHNVSGTVTHSEEFGPIIQFTGDIRNQALQTLTDHNICSKELIKVHGD